MPAVLDKLVTIEEFEKYPEPADGSKQELVRGKVITMPPPKARHGIICQYIAMMLGKFVYSAKLGWVATNDTGVIIERDPDTLRGADVAFWSIEREPVMPEGYFESVPDIAVEVLSPDDRKKAVREKLQDYVSSGVKLVWVVDPEIRIVTVYAGSMRGTELDENETITGGDVLPGFSCKVADFFG
jgi:Uma2 family endonuclease